MECKVCGNNDRFQVAQRFEEFSVVVCDNCQFGIVDPIPSQEVLDELYNSSEYFKSHMYYDFDKITESEVIEKINSSKSLHKTLLKNLKINETKSMLEIGSGGGFALKGFEEMGFKVEGVETSIVAATFAREQLHLKIHSIPFEEFKTKKKYDLILLNHVLEHFIDIRSVTRKLVGLLAPAGILYVRVPDHDSYDRRKYGKKWPAYAYYHISNFSEASLLHLFRQDGLKILKTKKFFSEKSPFIVKKVFKKLIRSKWFINRYSGRTIAILGQKP